MDNLLTENVDKVAGNAYKAGRAARLEEIGKEFNPHKMDIRDDKAYRSWLCGWFGADDELSRESDKKKYI